MTATNDATPGCSSYAWCIDHSREDHSTATRLISASADPGVYDYDLAGGAVRVPLIVTRLEAPVDGHDPAPRIVLEVMVPGGNADVEVGLTFREAKILRDQLSELLLEAER